MQPLLNHYKMLFRYSLPIFIEHIKKGNWYGVLYIARKVLHKLLKILIAPIGLLLVTIMRAIRPWLLIRVNIIPSERMGHFAGNMELYLCERDAGINLPRGRHLDLWYHNWPPCNRQLARMWNRTLHVGPRWLLSSVDQINAHIPGGDVHQIGTNTSHDRDVHNLLDRFPAHLSFLSEEEKKGEIGLRALGIPEGAPFVCLQVRDSGYLKKTLPWQSWDYHNYRNCDIQNYILAALELASRGYYVVRMGVVVNEAMNVDHPMIIDYAAKGMRNDFMDVYLGAKCAFCISNGTGFDAIPYIFRRPIVYVDHVPLGIINTFSSRFMATTKKHWLRKEKRFMTFREIFESGAGEGLSSREDGLGIGVDLFESSPEEISAVILEMEERLRGVWQEREGDEELQRQFWRIFPKNELHGEIRSRFGADFLRRHKDWLE